MDKDDTIMEYIEWIRVNPAGNITCLVTTKVPREFYLDVANRLLSLPGEDFEQVGFIIDETTMEMAGQEFCGNASRSFGLWAAREKGIKGKSNIMVNVSGLKKPFEVFIDTKTNFTCASMPLPRESESISEGMIMGCPKVMRVDLAGIMHFVVLDVPYSDHIFSSIKDYGMAHFNPAALGVMFVDSKNYTMVPIVYVKEVNTIYNEGSCGSGTVAAIIALEEKCAQGGNIFKCKLLQPRGEICATLYKCENTIKEITIEGPIGMGETQKVMFENLTFSQ